MKEIRLDPLVEKIEKDKEAVRVAEKERYDAAMEDFRESMAYKYVLKFFDDAEKRITEGIEQIQKEELQSVFLLPKKERETRVEQMSRRDSLLTGLMDIVKEVKSRL